MSAAAEASRPRRRPLRARRGRARSGARVAPPFTQPMSALGAAADALRARGSPSPRVRRAFLRGVPRRRSASRRRLRRPAARRRSLAVNAEQVARALLAIRTFSSPTRWRRVAGVVARAGGACSGARRDASRVRQLEAARGARARARAFQSRRDFVRGRRRGRRCVRRVVGRSTTACPDTSAPTLRRRRRRSRSRRPRCAPAGEGGYSVKMVAPRDAAAAPPPRRRRSEAVAAGGRRRPPPAAIASRGPSSIAPLRAGGALRLLGTRVARRRAARLGAARLQRGLAAGRRRRRRRGRRRRPAAPRRAAASDAARATRLAPRGWPRRAGRRSAACRRARLARRAGDRRRRATARGGG